MRTTKDILLTAETSKFLVISLNRVQNVKNWLGHGPRVPLGVHF